MTIHAILSGDLKVKGFVRLQVFIKVSQRKIGLSNQGGYHFGVVNKRESLMDILFKLLIVIIQILIKMILNEQQIKVHIMAD